jgi:peptidoglycan-associated lipoprotein
MAKEGKNVKSMSIRSLLFVGLLALGASACRPAYPKCKSDGHCQDKGEVCVEGICKQCSTDAQCKEGFSCKANACVALPQCSGDGDCAAGLKCRAGACAPECSGDVDCALGQKCSANRCTSADDSGNGSAGKGANCALQIIQFGFNEFDLSDEARTALDNNAECLRGSSGGATIEGHADERGTEEYNLVLSEKRANAAKRYLVGLGLTDVNLGTVGFGEERPVAEGHDESSWSTNRRAEFKKR